MREQNSGGSESRAKNRNSNASFGKGKPGANGKRGSFKKFDGKPSGSTKSASGGFRKRSASGQGDGDTKFKSNGSKRPYNKGGKGGFDRKSSSSDGYKKRFDKAEGARDDAPRSDRSERGERKSFDRKPQSNRGGFKGNDRKREFGKDDRKRDFNKDDRKRDFKSSGKPQGGRGGASGSKPAGKRASGQKQNRALSKKELDRRNLQALVNDDGPVYKGELDPMRGERSQIAMGKISREAKRAQEEREREQKELERAERIARENEDLPLSEKFEKSEASMGRLAALDVTRTVRRRNAYAQELIESRIDNNPELSPADRAFATLLTLGVVSTYGLLDEVINRGLKKPDDISYEVRDALRISTYEIIMLGKEPHAAVDQGVELVKAIVPNAAGLANAVLHRVLRMREEFPFGDPKTDLNALARLYAFPKWMARMLIEDMGAQTAADLMRVSNDPAPLFIHVNAIKATDEEVAAVFEEAGAHLTPAQAADIYPEGCFHVTNPRVLADKNVRDLFDQGKILVSDAAAQVVASALLPDAKPASFLEIGAGRGTKTIMLQSYAMRKYGEQMKMTSLDSHEFKVRLLEDRVAQYGVELDSTVVGNATRMDSLLPGQTFDAVFVDTPCSGLGTLRRHQEIRWRINENHIQELADTSLAILKSASGCVAPGGSLVYATCTVTYAENNGVVKRFLESAEGSDFALAPIADRPCIASKITNGSADAHFCARFVRKAE